jgi:DNA-binding winged helix-turn-helix (wHTH) protein/TolB-like protein/Tfp pilus assembly protein PilF
VSVDRQPGPVEASEAGRSTQKPPGPGEKLKFAGFTIDLERRILLDDQDRPVELRPQAYDVLRLLALNAGRLVTKEELLASVWPDVIVTDDSLVQAISDVRHALGEAGHRVVKTIPRRGYMLVDMASVRASTVADVPVQPTSKLPSELSRQRIVLLLVGGIIGGLVLVGAWIFFLRDPADPAQAGVATRPSIAVLAFKGPQDDIDGEALAREVAADLVSELARSADLRVVSNESSFQFSVRQTPLPEIGQRLRSRYFVDGTVRRDGDQVRMVVQLLDSQSGQVVWASSHTVDRTTLGAIQQALVSRIAGTLQSRVARTEDRHALAQPPKTLDVIVLTARGKSMMQRYSAQGVREARRFLDQALGIDPNYAPAWAFLGIVNTIDIGLHLTGEWDRSRGSEVLAQVQRAVALQPDLPMAYAALADAQGLLGNFDAALAAAQECLRLSPNDAVCFYVLGSAQLRLGQVESAVQNFEQALDRNPLPPANLPAFYATALWASGRLEEAVHMADDCLVKAPSFVRCRQDRIAALVELGRVGEAREEAARLRAQYPQMTAQQFRLVLADTAATLGERRIAAARAAGLP